VYVSRSADGGESWSEPEPGELPNNNSSVQYVPLADGRLALVLNNSSAADSTARRVSLYDEIDDEGLASGGPADQVPASQAHFAAGGGTGTAFWGAPRAPLTLALSADGGRTWPVMRDLETGDGHCLTNNSRDKLNREFSYPTILQGADGTLHIAYTYWRQAIKYVRVAPDWAAGV
uniref:exo-alpha-sialidase n=1 Tax=Streptomyces niveus TaxID=193462 RepID=UPI001495CCE0